MANDDKTAARKPLLVSAEEITYKGRIFISPYGLRTLQDRTILLDADLVERETSLDDIAAIVGLGDVAATGEARVEITIRRLDDEKEAPK